MEISQYVLFTVGQRQRPAVVGALTPRKEISTLMSATKKTKKHLKVQQLKNKRIQLNLMQRRTKKKALPADRVL